MPGAEPRQVPPVVHASIAVRWVVGEVGSAEALGLLADVPRWQAPRLLLTEVASGLRRKVVEGTLLPIHADEALEQILGMVDEALIALADDEKLVASALRLSITLRHKLPDCLYLALARLRGAALATADRALARLAGEQGIEVLAVPSDP